MNINTVKINKYFIDLIKSRYNEINNEQLLNFIIEKRLHPFNINLKVITNTRFDNEDEFFQKLKENNFIVENVDFNELSNDLIITLISGVKITIVEEVGDFTMNTPNNLDENNFINKLYKQKNFSKIILKLKNESLLQKFKNIKKQDYFIFID